MRLICLLHIGTNSTDKPTIEILNYNYINPGTTISVSFAGIQSLNSVNVNTISMSVMLYYTNINSSTYLYMPTPMITRPTNNTLTIPDRNSGGYVWLNYWSMSCGYTGRNVVRQSTNFWVTIWPPNSYPFSGWSYSSTGADADYVLLKFIPKHVIDPYNAVSITCTGCTYVEVFYATGIVRFRHSRTISGGNPYNFTFTNFPSSAYSIS
jgi:hypothetical protein